MLTVLTCAEISEDVYKDRGSTVHYFEPVHVPAGSVYRSNHFFGSAYWGHSDVGIVAFRGSLELEDWLAADGDILFGKWPVDQLGNAFGYFTQARAVLKSRGCKRFVVVGHSLGGGLAAVVAARLGRQPVSGVTFNAPGMAAFREVATPWDDAEQEPMTSHIRAAGKMAKEKNLFALGAVIAAGLEGAKSITRKVVEMSEVRATVEVDMRPTQLQATSFALKDSVNVMNIRSLADPVSAAKFNHIGRVHHVIGGGFHPIGSLVAALRKSPIGYFRV